MNKAGGEKIVSIKYVLECILLSTFLLAGIVAYSLSKPLPMVWLILIVNFYTTIKVRSNWYLLIISSSILYGNYSLCYANYIHPVDSYFVQWSSDSVSYKGLLILLVASIIYCIFIPIKMSTRKEKHSLLYNNQDNIVVFFFICVVLTFILIYGFSRPAVAGERGSPSSFYEYSIILFILGFYYTGKSRSRILLLSVLMLAFILQNFIYGGRITGIQLIICWTLCVCIDRLNLKIVLPIALFLMIILVGIGQMRASFEMNLENIKMAFNSIIKSGGALDTAYSSYYTSLTFIKVKEIINHKDQLMLFLKWILSMLFGGSVDNSNLAMFTHQFYVHYYGGILPFFGYFYIGWVGVVLFSGIVCFWERKLAVCSINSAGLRRCLSIYIVTTTLRWYLYSPSQLIRGAIIMCICYGICYAVNNITKTRPKVNYVKGRNE